MEVALGDQQKYREAYKVIVLILVLVEVALGVERNGFFPTM